MNTFTHVNKHASGYRQTDRPIPIHVAFHTWGPSRTPLPDPFIKAAR